MKFVHFFKHTYVILGSTLIISCSSGGGGTTGPEEPRITENPTITAITFVTAKVNWKTNVNTTSTVKYGTVAGQYNSEETSNTLETNHEVTIQNLMSNTNYFFIVESGNDQGTAASGEQQFSTLKSPQDLINESWIEYANGNFALAIATFTEAINVNPSHPGIEDAFNGLGWSNASNSIDSLDKAIQNFNSAILRKSDFDEAFAGRGFTHLAQKNYNDAIEDLERTLQISANFEFSHNSEINANDVHLGLGEAYFFKQELDKAQAEVTQLAPNNGLDSSNAATWVVDSVSYLSYAEALLAWIEKLKSTV